MNKQFFLLLSVIALVPGCGFFKSKKSEKRPVGKHEVMMDVDIPVAEDSVKDFFDTDMNELALKDAAIENDDAQYAWIEQTGKSANGFKKVYFDFDKSSIKASERPSAEYDAARMKDVLAKSEKDGKDIQFVVNGNADHAAGSDSYNRILSNQRAKELEDFAVAAGVPRKNITSVGRGYDVPELINGKPCTGNKDQQAPNRRDEIQVIVA